jgi:hypothetical protein
MNNIYAKHNGKVKCITFDAGRDYDKRVAEKYLTLNGEYTIDYTDVENWHTNVFLKECWKVWRM